MANLSKPVDFSKFRKSLTGNIKGLNASIGFNDPKTWLDTGSYALNYLISNDFFKGVPLEGKMTQFAGDSGCLPGTATVNIRLRKKTDEQ